MKVYGEAHKQAHKAYNEDKLPRLSMGTNYDSRKVICDEAIKQREKRANLKFQGEFK